MAEQSENEQSDYGLQCSSSSFDDSCDDSDTDTQLDVLTRQRLNLGTQPYLFEPEKRTESSSESEDDSEAANGDDWCSCSNCQEMATTVENRCCRRIPQIFRKLEEFEGDSMTSLVCLTEHPGFNSVCLDRFVLETAYYQYRQTYGEEEVDDNKRNRYTGYRQLARWCWGYLGKQVRVPLPSCAVIKIRETFPSDGEYQGFHFAG